MRLSIDEFLKLHDLVKSKYLEINKRGRVGKSTWYIDLVEVLFKYLEDTYKQGFLDRHQINKHAFSHRYLKDKFDKDVKEKEEVVLRDDYAYAFFAFVGYYDINQVSILLENFRGKNDLSKENVVINKPYKVELFVFYAQQVQFLQDDGNLSELVTGGYLELTYHTSKKGIAKAWYDSTNKGSEGEFQIVEDKYITYFTKAYENNRVGYGNIYIDNFYQTTNAKYFFGVRNYISAFNNNCVGAKFLFERVVSINEAKDKLDNIDYRIVNFLRGSRVESLTKTYKTLNQLKHASYFNIIGNKLSGVYESYSLFFPKKSLVSYIFQIYEDGSIIGKSRISKMFGNIQLINKGRVASIEYHSEFDENKEQGYREILKYEDDFNILKGTYLGIGSLSIPRIGRTIWIKSDKNFDELEPKKISFSKGIRTFLHQNSVLNNFFSGELDQYIDPYYKFSKNYKITSFYAACYLAQQNQLSLALEKLKEAILGGFHDKELLKKELSRGGALEKLKDKIDLNDL